MPPKIALVIGAGAVKCASALGVVIAAGDRAMQEQKPYLQRLISYVV